MSGLMTSAASYRFTWNKTAGKSPDRRAYLKRVCRLRFSFFRWFFVLCADALCGLPDGWLRCVRRGTSRDGRSVLRDFVSMG